jgi:hypothetical protein
VPPQQRGGPGGSPGGPMNGAVGGPGSGGGPGAGGGMMAGGMPSPYAGMMSPQMAAMGYGPAGWWVVMLDAWMDA